MCCFVNISGTPSPDLRSGANCYKVSEISNGGDCDPDTDSTCCDDGTVISKRDSLTVILTLTPPAVMMVLSYLRGTV